MLRSKFGVLDCVVLCTSSCSYGFNGSCINCLSGTYQALSGQLDCTVCGAGTGFMPGCDVGGISLVGASKDVKLAGT